MEKKHSGSKILEALLRKSTYAELEDKVRRYEALLTFIADATARIRNKALRGWKTNEPSKGGRPRTTDGDDELVRAIGYLRRGGEITDAQAIREFIENINAIRAENGCNRLNALQKKRKEKTLQNRLINARKRMESSQNLK